MRKILFHDLHGKVRHFLNALQDIEPAPAAVALHGIGGIGDQLQLTQDELRNHQDAIEKAGFGDVGDAAIDNHAGVENLEGLLGRFFPAENTAQRRQVQHVALGGAHDQADISHEQQENNLYERLGCGLADHQRHQKRAQDSEHRTESRPDEPLETNFFQADFEENNCATDYESTARGNCWRKPERMQGEGGGRENENKDSANNCQIEQAGTPLFEWENSIIAVNYVGNTRRAKSIPLMPKAEC